MLVNENIEIKWEYKTRKHYEQKGYIFTKYKDKFIIRIEDLPKSSDVKIPVTCDYCGIRIDKMYKKYIKQREDVQKDCCTNKDCSNKKGKEVNLIIYGCTNYSKTDKSRNDNSKRFRMNFATIEDEFKNRGYTLLTKDFEYKNNKTKLRFICDKHSHEGVLTIDWCHFVSNKSKGCKYCSDERRGWDFKSWEQRAQSSGNF